MPRCCLFRLIEESVRLQLSLRGRMCFHHLTMVTADLSRQCQGPPAHSDQLTSKFTAPSCRLACRHTISPAQLCNGYNSVLARLRVFLGKANLREFHERVNHKQIHHMSRLIISGESLGSLNIHSPLLLLLQQAHWLPRVLSASHG